MAEPEGGERHTERIRYLQFFIRGNNPTHLVDFDVLGVAGVLHCVITAFGSVGLVLLLRSK